VLQLAESEWGLLHCLRRPAPVCAELCGIVLRAGLALDSGCGPGRGVSVEARGLRRRKGAEGRGTWLSGTACRLSGGRWPIDFTLHWRSVEATNLNVGHCVLGSHRSGSHCTSRVLSAVLYLAPSDWRPGSAAGCDGGSLRIYRPAAAAAAHRITPDLADEEDNDVLVEIAPIEGRLVLFLSDLRCPHEVLPVLQAGRERYSMITWFTNTIEDGGSVV